MYLLTFDLCSADAPRNNIDAAIRWFDSEARYIATTSWLISTSVDINTLYDTLARICKEGCTDKEFNLTIAQIDTSSSLSWVGSPFEDGPSGWVMDDPKENSAATHKYLAGMAGMGSGLGRNGVRLEFYSKLTYFQFNCSSLVVNSCYISWIHLKEFC